MRYRFEPLSNGRWGIYKEHALLATIGCEQACQEIIAVLNQRHGRKRLIRRQNLNFTTPIIPRIIEVKTTSGTTAQAATSAIEWVKLRDLN